jgi:hypothetical protein
VHPAQLEHRLLGRGFGHARILRQAWRCRMPLAERLVQRKR